MPRIRHLITPPFPDGRRPAIRRSRRRGIGGCRPAAAGPARRPGRTVPVQRRALRTGRRHRASLLPATAPVPSPRSRLGPPAHLDPGQLPGPGQPARPWPGGGRQPVVVRSSWRPLQDHPPDHIAQPRGCVVKVRLSRDSLSGVSEYTVADAQ